MKSLYYDARSEKHQKVSVFEKRVLRKIFGPKRDEVEWDGENYITKSFVILLHAKYYYGNEIKKRQAKHAA